MKSIYKPFTLAFLITCSFNSCKKEVEDLNPGPSQIEYKEYSINSDENNNLKPNPGEKFSLRVKVKNTGNYHLKNVKAKLISNNPDVVVESADNVNFYSGVSNYKNPTIYKGTEGYGDFNLMLGNNLKGGEDFLLFLELEDEAKFVYRDTFLVLVYDTGRMCKFHSYTTGSGYNGDGEFNPGEYHYFQPYVLNVGSESLSYVKIKIFSSSPYVKYFYFNNGQYCRESGYPYSNTVDIRSGSLAKPNGSGELELYPNTPVGTIIPFEIELEDLYGTVWKDTMKVKVVSSGSDIQFKDFEVFSDNNNDKKINPGETVHLKVNLKNLGKVKAPGVKVKFSSTDVRINSVLPNSQVSFNSTGRQYPNNTEDFIFSDALGYSHSNDYLNFKVHPSALPGTKIKIDMNIKDSFNQYKDESFEFTVE